MSITPSQISGHSGTTTISVVATSATSFVNTTWTVRNASGESVQVTIKQKFSPPANQIWYKTSDSQTATTYWKDVWSNNSVLPSIASNTYANGWGIIQFNGNLDRISVPVFSDQPTVTEIWLPEGITGVTVSGASISGGGTVNIPGQLVKYNSQVPALSAITLPSTVRRLGRLVLANQSACPVNELTIPDGVEFIESLQYLDVSELTIPDSVTGFSSQTFMSCTTLERITIGSGITEYPTDMFKWCPSLHSLTIGKNVTVVEPINAMGLNEIISYATTAPAIDKNNANYVDQSSSGTFYYPDWSDYSEWKNHVCFSNWDFVPMSSASQPANELWYSTTDSSAVTPNVSTGWGATITANTYSNGKGVLAFDGPISAIPSNAFDGNMTMTRMSIPEGVVVIGDGVVTGNRNFAELNLPNSVTGIGGNAFIQLGLRELTIPSGVVRIDDGAFAFQDWLSKIVAYPTTAPSIGSVTFYGIGYGGTLYYPQGSDYSSWMSTEDFYLGAAGFTSQTFNPNADNADNNQ